MNVLRLVFQPCPKLFSEFSIFVHRKMINFSSPRNEVLQDEVGDKSDESCSRSHLAIRIGRFGGSTTVQLSYGTVRCWVQKKKFLLQRSDAGELDMRALRTIMAATMVLPWRWRSVDMLPGFREVNTIPRSPSLLAHSSATTMFP